MKRRLFSRTIGIPVVSEETMMPVSFVKDVIIDYTTGHIAAFLLPRNQVVMPQDVLEWRSSLLIPDEDCIAPVEDLIRVQEVVRRSHRIFGKKVVTENGIFLGRVYDLCFDFQTNTLLQINVAKFFVFVRFDKKIIDRKSIVEIKKDTIIVKDLTVPVQEVAMPAAA